MKNVLLLLSLFPLFLSAQNGFVVTGKVAGLPEGAEVKITTTTQDERVLTSGMVKGGQFTMTGAVPEPGLYWLMLGKEQPQHVYLENKSLTVSGDRKDIRNLKIEGSPSHNDFDAFRKIFNPLVGELNAAAAQVGQAGDEKSATVLMGRYDSLKRLINSEVGKFIGAKRSSHVSAFLLGVTAQLLEDPLTMEQRYQSLDSSIRYSLIGRSLADFIAYNKVGAVGTEALEFTQNDVSGRPVSLSAFKGKYVLLDFWASWCKPCRQENPNVVKAYQRFNNKNFTILSVSLDQEKESWLKAIEKDKSDWTNVSDLQHWRNAVAVQYHVEGIPQNFLIDPQGKIIAKNLRGEELTAKLCEVLGCN